MKKSFLFGILAVLLAGFGFGGISLAECTESSVAKLGEECYDTLQGAFDAATEINMELRIEKGYGYYSLDYLRNRDKKSEGKDVNVLLIDNDFKLVDYVKYDVQEVIEDFNGSTKDTLVIEVFFL